MPMPPELRAKRLSDTRAAAAALLEDLQHLRDIISRPEASRGEIRRASGVLRRLLVERDLTIVAAPRMGKFLITAPDNMPYYKTERSCPYVFFGSGGAPAFNLMVRGARIEEGHAKRVEVFDPERTVQLRLDGFLSQRVLCLEDQWAKRSDVIKYVANVLSGIHSDLPDTPEKILLARIAQVMVYSRDASGTKVELDLNALSPGEPDFRYSPDAINAVLYEILSAIHYLLISPDLLTLHDMIVKELYDPR